MEATRVQHHDAIGVTHRLIPIVLLRLGVVVQSKQFTRYQRLGDPVTIVQRLSDWWADELIYLDISPEPRYDVGRDDLKAPNRRTILEILRDISARCFMPLTFGGGIRTLQEAAIRIQTGADKIAVNTQPLQNPSFIEACAKEFGSQCVVVSIDVRGRGDDGSWQVYARGGKTPTGRHPVVWAREVEAYGAGEILLNSIDRDGSGQGYDLELIQAVCQAVRIPVIAAGGVGTWEHLVQGLVQGGASAVAAANIFHYTENSVYRAKQFLYGRGMHVRQPSLGIQVPS